MSEAEEYLELCKTALDDLGKGEKADQSLRTLYSRLYYATFYAAKAALLSLGIETRSHAGIADQVFKVLYREKQVIDKETAAVLSRVQTRRDQSDYELEMNETEENYRQIKTEAEDFIRKMREVVESEN